MMLSMHFLSAYNGAEIDDFSDAQDVIIRTGDHGYWSLEGFIRMGQEKALEFYEGDFRPYIFVTYGGDTVWEGRVEDYALRSDGLGFIAYGMWRAFHDRLYTALWSDSGYGRWEQLSRDDNALYFSGTYEADNNNRLIIIPREGETVDNDAHVGAWGYEIPSRSDRQIVGISFSYEKLDNNTNWHMAVARADGSWNPVTSDQWLQDTNSASLQTGTGSADWSSNPTDRVVFMFYYDQAADYVFPTETDSVYGKLTNIRVYTSAGSTLYADEIALGLADYVAEHNAYIHAPGAVIQSPGIDLDTYIVEDGRPADVLDDLAAIGDDQTPPRHWEVGVWEHGHLHFRPQMDDSNDNGFHKVWYASVSELEIERSLSDLYNAGYAKYSGGQRTATAVDANSIASHGVRREQSVDVNTSSQTRAETHRDAMLSDYKSIEPTAQMIIDQITDSRGAVAQLWEVRAGDMIFLANLSPEFAGLDGIRAFRIRTTEYRPGRDGREILSLTPRELSKLEVLVARSAA